MLRRAAITALILAGGAFSQQPPPATSPPPPQTVKRISEVHALKLQNLQLQYQILAREVCEEAGFPVGECQVRAESGMVIRVPVAPEMAKPPEVKKPEAIKSEAPKSAMPKSGE